MFSVLVVSETANVIDSILDKFEKDLFLKQVFDDLWDEKELKQRYQHIAQVLWTFMPQNYEQAVDYLIAIADKLAQKSHHKTYGTFPYMFLPTCIEFYGLHDFQNSMKGLERITQLVSAEFAVRPFYVQYPEQMLTQTMLWTFNKSEQVRRLASEGCRPALPWGMALTAFKKNPKALIPILEKLKEDDSLFVRKSVANNLNDISKTHPELVTELAKKWSKKNKHTDWIIKHACRTLLKNGNAAVMSVFGYENPNIYDLKDFWVDATVPAISKVHFSFLIINKATAPAKTRIEYALYFLRKNGQHNKKVFMISDSVLDPLATLSFTKSYSFKPISTRKYYAGLHRLAIIVNGVAIGSKEFQLLDS